MDEDGQRELFRGYARNHGLEGVFAGLVGYVAAKRADNLAAAALEFFDNGKRARTTGAAWEGGQEEKGEEKDEEGESNPHEPPTIARGHAAVVDQASAVLTSEVFAAVRCVRLEPRGWTVGDLIRAAVLHPEGGVGVVCPDSLCYIKFSALLYPLLQALHGVPMPPPDPQPLNSEPSCLAAEKLSSTYVVSVCVSVERNIGGHALSAGMSLSEMASVEHTVRGVMRSASQMQGAYTHKTNVACHEIAVANLPPSLTNLLESFHILPALDPAHPALQCVGLTHHWPRYRTVFSNRGCTLMALCNVMSHVRLVSVAKGADVARAFGELVGLLEAFEKGVGQGFCFSPDLGYLSAFPERVGTGLEVTAKVKLPALSRNPSHLKSVCADNELVLQDPAHTLAHSRLPGDSDGLQALTMRGRIGLTEVLDAFMWAVNAVVEAEVKARRAEALAQQE